MSSFKKDLDEIAEIKKRWLDASATEESRRLQAQIEEKKKASALAKKKEEKIIMDRSKICRSFYRKQYNKEREEEKRQMEELTKKLHRVEREHRQAREMEHEETQRETQERASRLRKEIKAIEEQRQKDLEAARHAHEDFYRSFKRQQKEVVQYHRAASAQSLRSSYFEEKEIALEVEHDRIAQTILCNELASVEHSRQLERKRELQEEQERRKKEARAEAKRAKEIAHLKQLERKFHSLIEHLVTSEGPGRTNLLFKEREERYELCHMFNSVVSRTYMEEMKQKSDERSKVKMSKNLTPVPDSSDLLRASERSAQRSREAMRRAESRQHIVHDRHSSATSFRRQRLQRVREFVQEEAEKTGKMRLEALQRRRGQKLATETEPFQVAEGISDEADPLPPHLQSIVIDIIRGKTTKEDVDFNTL